MTCIMLRLSVLVSSSGSFSLKRRLRIVSLCRSHTSCGISREEDAMPAALINWTASTGITDEGFLEFSHRLEPQAGGRRSRYSSVRVHGCVASSRWGSGAPGFGTRFCRARLSLRFCRRPMSISVTPLIELFFLRHLDAAPIGCDRRHLEITGKM
jgi:hypothetical protein